VLGKFDAAKIAANKFTNEHGVVIKLIKEVAVMEIIILRKDELPNKLSPLWNNILRVLLNSSLSLGKISNYYKKIKLMLTMQMRVVFQV